METAHMTSGISSSGPMGAAIPLAPLGIGTPMYLSLPLCLDQSGHRFSIGLYHKDRAVCERCGLIRKQRDAS